MNRRELIKRIGQCVGGLTAFAIGVKAASTKQISSRYRVPEGDYGDVRMPLPPRRYDQSRLVDVPHEWRGFDLYVQNAEGAWVPAIAATTNVGHKTKLVLEPNTMDAHVVDVVIEDYKNNGRIRQVIQADREWGL